MIYLIIAGLLVIVDQWTKYYVVQHIQLGESVPFIKGYLSITHLHNDGAAWSILQGKMGFFIVISIIAIIVVLYFMRKYQDQSKWFLLGLALILAGTVGNFIDRVRQGYVVDMIQTDFINFPIFNVADSALTVGVFCIAIYLILDEYRERKGLN